MSVIRRTVFQYPALDIQLISEIQIVLLVTVHG